MVKNLSAPYPCYFLSSELASDLSFQTLTFSKNGESIQLQVPIVDKAWLTQSIALIKAKRAAFLGELRTSEIVELLDQAVQRWLDPTYEQRKLAEAYLPIITGYAPEMVRIFLSTYLRQFRREKLLRIIDQDFPNPLVLDEFRSRPAGGLQRAYGPEVVTHIFSGNVPALPLFSMVAGILLKSATIGKLSSSEPFFPVLFAKTLQELEPRLAESMLLCWWKGGNVELEECCFQASEAVIAYGSSQTIEQIKSRVPARVRFLAHGHKVSFGVITNECLEPSKVWGTAQLAARDASWFDQQGCLSPHLFFVEDGGAITPRDFAHLLAKEMDNFQRKMPRATLSIEEQQAIIQARVQAEFSNFQGDHLRSTLELIASENDTAWTVVYLENPEHFPFSVLNRFIYVVPISSIEVLRERLATVKNVVQTAGVATSPQKFSALITLLGELGVNRICALGEMPNPEPGWHHDGRYHLADLVRWCDVETSVEARMEQYDPDRV